MARDRHAGRIEFAEEMGIFFEKTGFPRMAGRIWGWLLICDPPEQTAAQIAEALQASRGSVSTMTRLLQIWGVERIGIPGTRGGFYRIRSDGLLRLLETERQMFAEIRQMSERGLNTLKNEPPKVRARLMEGRDLFAFVEREYPLLIEKWKKQRKKRPRREES
jgi:DNA-binding transcriptional regulator GbsR (MarR family)